MGKYTIDISSLPYVYFGSGHRVTEKGNYSEEDSRRLIKQILNGVAYLHSHGGCLLSVTSVLV